VVDPALDLGEVDVDAAQVPVDRVPLSAPAAFASSARSYMSSIVAAETLR
jgi:hypothetical protein